MNARWYAGGVVLALAAASLLVGTDPATPAEAEDVTLHLFNGKDLSNFYTYLGAPRPGAELYGKDQDPDKVFTVRGGRLRVSGQVFGGLITRKDYENYHLVVEYAWGEDTWAPRKDKARDSGVFLHCAGKDGAVGGLWPEAIECNVMEGRTGELVLVGGKHKPSLTATVVEEVVGEKPRPRKELYYKPGAPPRTFTTGVIHWRGCDPHWKDVKGYRGQRDVELAVGQWNRLECVCDGAKITVILNGKKVNACTEANPHKGRILVQSEGAEIFFRRIDLKPLAK